MKEYDYIIAGAGIAGTVCGKLLAQKGKHCIILESQDCPHEKICGGFIPHRAIVLLKYLGLDPDSLFDEGAIKISGVITKKNQVIEKHKYHNKGYGMGAYRILLQKMLIKQAMDCGCEIKYSERVSCINRINNSYYINGFSAKHFISAIGAGSLSRNYPLDWRNNQTYGISEIIKGEFHLEKDYVYFFYPNENCLDYFWFIPIYKDVWNVGYWSTSYIHLKNTFFHLRGVYVPQYFKNITTLRIPKGAICGSEDYSFILNKNAYGIGDYAGTCSPDSGAGIFSAIKSAKDLVQSF